MPSSSAAIWAMVVCCPWPWLCSPTARRSLPSGSTRSEAVS